MVAPLPFPEDYIMPEKKQHVDIQRKLKLRETLLQMAGDLTGACYIPFIGEGDIAVALYKDKEIYGADIDAGMVKTAQERLPASGIVKADCDKFPFTKGTALFTLADFDAYSFPYDSFRSFFEGATLGSQCVLIFTDGQRQAIIRTGHYRTPDGVKHHAKTKTEKRSVFNFYFHKTIMPWFREYIKPWTIIYITKYLRGPNRMYWGAIIARPGEKNGKKASSKNTTTNNKSDKKNSVDITTSEEKRDVKPYKFDDIKKAKYLENISNGHTRGYAATLVGVHRSTISDHMKANKEFAEQVSEAETDAIAKIENALFEAANSGNVTAIQVYLYNRNPKRWSDKRNIQLSGEGGGPIKVEVDGKSKLLSILNRLATRARETEGDK